jgi:hypothetical protein
MSLDYASKDLREMNQSSVYSVTKSAKYLSPLILMGNIKHPKIIDGFITKKNYRWDYVSEYATINLENRTKILKYLNFAQNFHVDKLSNSFCVMIKKIKKKNVTFVIILNGNSNCKRKILFLKMN